MRLQPSMIAQIGVSNILRAVKVQSVTQGQLQLMPADSLEPANREPPENPRATAATVATTSAQPTAKSSRLRSLASATGLPEMRPDSSCRNSDHSWLANWSSTWADP